MLDSRWEERAQDGSIRCIGVRLLTKSGTGGEKHRKNQEERERRHHRRVKGCSSDGRDNSANLVRPRMCRGEESFRDTALDQSSNHLTNSSVCPAVPEDRTGPTGDDDGIGSSPGSTW